MHTCKANLGCGFAGVEITTVAAAPGNIFLSRKNLFGFNVGLEVAITLLVLLFSN